MKRLQISIFILAVASTVIFSFRHFASAQDGTVQALLSQHAPPKVVVGGQRLELDAVIQELAEKRIVFVGESHDRFDHHLNQLEVIKRLHERAPRWAIGLEFFQQPFQEYLDAYIAGQIGEREFLEKTEYFQRWRFDYRLYRPIFRYAREQGIPLLALNIPNEINRKVGQSGIVSLNEKERVWVPKEIDKSDADYRERLKAVFEEHEGFSEANFEYFWEAQLLWDEAMAERAARYLAEHPERSMVVLAGSGHIARGAGIPNRLQRRLPADSAILLQSDSEQENADDARGADYLLVTKDLPLPPSGRIGVMLEPAEKGMNVQSVLPDSGAQKAGIQSNDQIVAIGDWPVQTMQDVRLAMLDREPGDTITVTVQRKEGNERDQILALEVILQ